MQDVGKPWNAGERKEYNFYFTIDRFKKNHLMSFSVREVYFGQNNENSNLYIVLVHLITSGHNNSTNTI